MARNYMASNVIEVSVLPAKSCSRQSNMANTIVVKYTKDYKLNNEPK